MNEDKIKEMLKDIINNGAEIDNHKWNDCEIISATLEINNGE